MILQVENLSKQYKHHDGIIDAIRNITVSIKKGTFVTITGPSGCGKTTLLLTLGGLIRPTSGTILFEGKPLLTGNDTHMAGFRSRNVGYIMQNFALIPYLTATENIMAGLALHKNNSSQQKESANALLCQVGLENRKNHYPRELSAGQQQRVAIARALANNPSLLLADEPTGNLDPSLSLEILNLMKQINDEKQITVIMVTHSPIAANFGNHRIHLKDGSLSN